MSRARHKLPSKVTGVGVATDLVSGNPNVVRETKAKVTKGGKVEAMKVDGKKPKHRADKIARKTGGRVGGTDATTAGGLYSSAARVVHPARMSKKADC